MGAGAGFEPALAFLQACVEFVISEFGKSGDTQLRTQNGGRRRPCAGESAQGILPEACPDLRSRTLEPFENPGHRILAGHGPAAAKRPGGR